MAAPDFESLERSFQMVFDAAPNIRDQIQNIRSIPAIDGSQQILQALAQLQAGMAQLQAGVDAIPVRIAAQDHNNLARMENSCANTLESPLVPLHNQTNEAPDGFPSVVSELARLTGAEAAQFLIFYEQRPPRTAEDRKTRFAKYIGVRAIPYT